MPAKAPKPIVFLGGSLSDLRAFPQGPRRMAGFQLDRVQHGVDPADWKPMSDIGAGVREIRVRDADGAFRVIYMAKLLTLCMCFIASRRRRSAPPSKTSSWRRTATSNCCRI